MSHCVSSRDVASALKLASIIIIASAIEHKGWCDSELSTNEQTRKEKTEAVETLHAEIDQLEASIAKLTENISELTQAVAIDLDSNHVDSNLVDSNLVDDNHVDSNHKGY